MKPARQQRSVPVQYLRLLGVCLVVATSLLVAACGGENNNDNLLAEQGDFSKLHLPETVEPGDLGGIESQLASNGKTVFAAVNNLAWTYKSQGLAGISPTVPFSKGTGEVVAVDVATGKVKWDHKLPSSAYGAATIANDVVFTTTFDGTRYGLDATNGTEVFKTKLSAGTNAPVGVYGDTVVTAASFPQGPGQKALIVAYRLGAKGKLPAPKTTTTPPPANKRPQKREEAARGELGRAPSSWRPRATSSCSTPTS